MITRLVRRWPLTTWWLLGLLLLTLMWQPYYYDTLIERVLWASDRAWGFWHLVPRLMVDPVIPEGRMQTILVQVIASMLGLAMVVGLDHLFLRWRTKWAMTRLTLTPETR
jgi:hypothetical protein